MNAGHATRPASRQEESGKGADVPERWMDPWIEHVPDSLTTTSSRSIPFSLQIILPLCTNNQITSTLVEAIKFSIGTECQGGSNKTKRIAGWKKKVNTRRSMNIRSLNDFFSFFHLFI